MDLASYVEERCIPEPNSGCWLWLLSIGSHGYGQGYTKETGVTVAHRLSHLAFKGPIPAGYEVDHTCRNRCCVNPDHLEAVTPTENERRMVASRGHNWRGDTEEERRLYSNAYKARWAREKRARLAGVS